MTPASGGSYKSYRYSPLDRSTPAMCAASKSRGFLPAGPNAILGLSSPGGMARGQDTMALSDACFEFLEAVCTAAQRLSAAVEEYGQPPFDYEEEIEALRQT